MRSKYYIWREEKRIISVRRESKWKSTFFFFFLTRSCNAVFCIITFFSIQILIYNKYVRNYAISACFPDVSFVVHLSFLLQLLNNVISHHISTCVPSTFFSQCLYNNVRLFFRIVFKISSFFQSNSIFIKTTFFFFKKINRKFTFF